MWGSWGEKKERERGTMGRRKREERLPPFPFSHGPPRASYFFFSITGIFIGIPSGSLCGGESDNEIIKNMAEEGT